MMFKSTHKAAVSELHKSAWFLIGSLITGRAMNTYSPNLVKYILWMLHNIIKIKAEISNSTKLDRILRKNYFVNYSILSSKILEFLQYYEKTEQ